MDILQGILDLLYGVDIKMSKLGLEGTLEIGKSVSFGGYERVYFSWRRRCI